MPCRFSPNIGVLPKRWRRAGTIAVGILSLMLGSGKAPAQSSQVQSSQVQSSQVQAKAFIEGYCIDCHRGKQAEAGVMLDAWDLTAADLSLQRSLQSAIDQIQLHNMPPPDGDQPAAGERDDAITALREILADMRRRNRPPVASAAPLRRLTRREYRNTIGDLLGIDMTMFDPTLRFPGDNLSSSFDNLSDDLVLSGHLLEHYLQSAELCVDKAFAVDENPQPQSWHFKDRFLPQDELVAAHRQAFNLRYLCLYDHPWVDKPEGAYGAIADFKHGAPCAGIYEVRVHAKAMHRDSPYDVKSVRIDLDEPFRMGIRVGDTSISDMTHVQPIQPKVAQAAIDDKDFQWYTFRIFLDQGFAPRFTFENGIDGFRASIGRIYRTQSGTLPASIRKTQGIFQQRIGLIHHGRVPHIRIDQIDIKGPVDFAWPTPARAMIYGGADFRPDEAQTRILAFARRAYRRPVSQAEADRLARFYQQRRDQDRTPEQALRDTITAILCSPEFLYFLQPHSTSTAASDSHTNHVIAERLAYFLTSTMPDDRLSSLATDGSLAQSQVQRSEVRRLLASDASDAMVRDFLDNWLDLRALGSMPPDPKPFWFYYAADLQTDAKRETELFLRDLIGRDAPISAMIDSDYSFINRDLAKLYQMPDAVDPQRADEFVRVVFNNPRRGGLLGQASVLTVSANGIETSPVVRGVWLLKNLLASPPPPPPTAVPAIEPDTRGALTIRDQLKQHRADSACMQCHRKIDPLGFALESFDPIGQWRQFYDLRHRQRIDTSGELPSGDRFDDVVQFKQSLLRHKEFFARAFVESLLAHALGRRMGPGDRPTVDKILDKHRNRDFPCASLITEVALCELVIPPVAEP